LHRYGLEAVRNSVALSAGGRCAVSDLRNWRDSAPPSKSWQFSDSSRNPFNALASQAQLMPEQPGQSALAAGLHLDQLDVKDQR